MGRRIVFATIVALATAWPAAAAESPTALADAIVKAGLAQKTVHYRVDAQLTNMKLVQIADIGANAGIQRITLTRSGGPGHVTVIVAGANAYIRGDARTLVEYMGFKSAGAKRFANRWVLVPRGNAHFAAIAGDVTLGSAMRGLRLPGTPTALPPE